jgi:hypothetical protein
MLEDTDGDGKMDKRTVFLDGLVMPRSLALVRDGLLVAEPPHLWFYQIRNGKAGARIEVAHDYAREGDPKLGRKAIAEETANGLTRQKRVGDMSWWLRSCPSSGALYRRSTPCTRSPAAAAAPAR